MWRCISRSLLCNKKWISVKRKKITSPFFFIINSPCCFFFFFPSASPPFLCCHVCESEGCGGWHSYGVKPDGSHKAGDVAQSNVGCTGTSTSAHNRSLTRSLLNELPWIIHHTQAHAHISHRTHTQLLSATEGPATSLYFIIISLGIFRGCKGIPGGARPLRLSTPPPPSSLPFPPHCTLSPTLSLCLGIPVIYFQLLLLPLVFKSCFASLLYSWAGCFTGKTRGEQTQLGG